MVSTTLAAPPQPCLDIDAPHARGDAIGPDGSQGRTHVLLARTESRRVSMHIAVSPCGSQDPLDFCGSAHSAPPIWAATLT